MIVIISCSLRLFFSIHSNASNVSIFPICVCCKSILETMLHHNVSMHYLNVIVHIAKKNLGENAFLFRFVIVYLQLLVFMLNDIFCIIYQTNILFNGINSFFILNTIWFLINIVEFLKL